MSLLPFITLKPGKDIPILAGHPWIFSEALSSSVSAPNGSLVEVRNARNLPIGVGTFSPTNSIRVRILTLNVREPVDAAFFSKRFAALDAWKRPLLPASTTGYRLVHAESDGIPGLIVDRYDDVFVFQLHTAGMDLLRQTIVDALRQTFRPRAIVERSDVEARGREDLSDRPITVHDGTVDAPVPFLEDSISFVADVLKGQKTGFFLDQRNARIAVGRYARNRRVLNLFGYTGAFSVHAAKGGATFVSMVDQSRLALEGAQTHLKMNGFDPEEEKKFSFLEADVLELLNEKSLPDGPFDLIICDPPAFAKTERNVPQALTAYAEINQACLEQLEPGGILVTCSCSGRVTPEDFRSALKIAAGRAGKNVRVLEWLTQPVDHAEKLAFPEGRYLKTAILMVV